MADTVLIVDDTPANLQVLGQILQGSGYAITAALNGREALSALQSNPTIDLILLDVMMPDIDGFETCRLIKEKLALKHIPIIFLTAKNELQDLLMGFQSGGVDYITKPFNREELLARVKTHVELKKAREEILMLRGIIPICSSCKKIRDDKGYWSQLETFLSSHSDMVFSHGYCPDCVKKLYPDLAESILNRKV